jgi:hypothetical protein
MKPPGEAEERTMNSSNISAAFHWGTVRQLHVAVFRNPCAPVTGRADLEDP